MGLTAVQMAIALMWVIYGLYLPQLLGLFGMPGEIAMILLVIESAVAALVQPLMGGLSDRTQYWLGTRFPLISVGVIFTSILFIAIPVVALFHTIALMKWLVVFTLVAWATAMAVFQSPVVALLGKYAQIPQLPLAAAFLTLAASLISATRPLVNQVIVNLGAIATFVLGSVVLLVAALVLRQLDPPLPPQQQPVDQSSLLPALALVGMLGLSIGWGYRLLLDTLAKVFSSQLVDANVDQLMVLMSLGLAAIALPAGFLATQAGNRRLMLVGLLVGIGGLQAVVRSPNEIALFGAVVVLIAALSLILNGVIPLTLSLLPAKAGLGTGFYLGGGAVATMVFGMVFSQPEQISIATGAVMVTISFMVALGCVVVSDRLRSVMVSKD